MLRSNLRTGEIIVTFANGVSRLQETSCFPGKFEFRHEILLK